MRRWWLRIVQNCSKMLDGASKSLKNRQNRLTNNTFSKIRSTFDTWRLLVRLVGVNISTLLSTFSGGFINNQHQQLVEVKSTYMRNLSPMTRAPSFSRCSRRATNRFRSSGFVRMSATWYSLDSALGRSSPCGHVPLVGTGCAVRYALSCRYRLPRWPLRLLLCCRSIEGSVVAGLLSTLPGVLLAT